MGVDVDPLGCGMSCCQKQKHVAEVAIANGGVAEVAFASAHEPVHPPFHSNQQSNVQD